MRTRQRENVTPKASQNSYECGAAVVLQITTDIQAPDDNGAGLERGIFYIMTVNFLLCS